MGKKCVIIGAGAGGLGTGAALLKNGYTVDIYERNNIIGGAGRSIDLDGFLLDDGIHYLVDIPGKSRHVDEVGEIFDIKTELAVMEGTQLTVVSEGIEYDMLQLLPISKVYDRNVLKKVFKYLNDEDAENCESFMKLMMSELQTAIQSLNLKSFDDIILRLPYIPLIDWLRDKTDNEKVIEFVLDLAQINVLIPKESIGTLKSYSVLSLFMGLSTGMFKYCYPTHPTYGGFGALLEPYNDYILDNGGKIHLNTRVKEIKIENGITKGIVIESENGEDFIPADLVVLNASPQMATKYKMLNPDDFPSEYKKDFINKVNAIQMGAKRYEVTSLNVYMALKKPIIDNDSFVVFVDHDGHVICGGQSYSIVNPASAPKGKQLWYMTMYLYKQPKDLKLAQTYIEEGVLPALRKWCPDVDVNTDWVLTNFSPIQYGELNQQMFSNSETFDTKTPVDGLYFTGMYTGLVGVDGALVAGIKTAESILDKKLMHSEGH